MRETKTTKEKTETNKNRFTPNAKELGEKVKVFIDKESESVKGNLRRIARMVSTRREEGAPVARALIGRRAPDFKATAVFEKDFKEVTLKGYAGQYVLLFFYPLDFTFVCPTELHAFQERLSEFKKRGVEVLGCSVDSQFSHLNWLRTPKEEGGIEGVCYGLISDLGGRIASDYGVLSEEGVAYRALFLIDKEGVVRHQLINDLPLGRNVEEAIRTVDALQHFEKNGEVCPANWEKGKKALRTNAESVAEYLSGPSQ